MKDYIDYMNQLSVDASLHEKILKHVTQKPKPRLSARPSFRFAGLAACAAVLLLCVLTVPGLLGDTPDIPVSPDVSQGGTPMDNEMDLSLLGLPVDNFSLAEIQDDSISFDRLAFFTLSDFFTYNAPDLFAFVRVLDTEQWTDMDSGYDGGVLKQTSSLRTLSTLWSRDNDAPETLSVSQSLYGGCVGDEKTNLLRPGGVYLLPLSRWQDGLWYLRGDLDVLFEVDDQGRVWTHSQHEAFSRFDGEDASTLAEAITVLTSDENLPAAITSFGQITRHWGVLIETEIVSATLTKDKWGLDSYQYQLTAEQILSMASEWPWSPDGEEIRAVSYSLSPLEEGKRYLMILDPSEDGPYIEPGRVAEIGDDGTITAIPCPDDTSVLSEFNGFTVTQIKEEAERAKAWHAAHVK